MRGRHRGCGERGSLGHGDREDQPQFKVIEALRRTTPSTTIEILTPDFRNKHEAAIEAIVAAYRVMWGCDVVCEASTWRVPVAGDSGVRSLSRRVVCALQIRGSARVHSGVRRYRDPKSSGSAGDASGT